jgi:hypothetical protein
MTVTYGHIAGGDEDPFLARARELIEILTRLITPEKAAMFTAFPFREFHNHTVDVDVDVENIGCSWKIASVVLRWRLCPDDTR